MTRKFLISCGCLVLSIFISKAQDTLVLNDGTLIKSKVIEITESTLKYKKYSNLNGPIYTIDKNQVLSIHYENGEQESFKTQQQTQRQEQEHQAQYEEQKLIEVPIADNNRELIAKYNEPMLYKGKISKKPAKFVTAKFGITKESILSNEDVEISICRTISGTFDGEYAIQVKNKSNKNIYIDLGNCFAINPDGDFRAFYNGTVQKSVNEGNVKGGAINLGGVANVLGVGGAIGAIAGGVMLGSGSQNSLTTTYINERLVSIPPLGVSYVSVYNEVVVKRAGLFSSAEFEMLNNGEDFRISLYKLLKRGIVSKGEIHTFSEDNSPYKRDYIITYSKERNFVTYTKVQFSIFLHQILGYTSPTVSWDLDQFEKDMRKTISNYNHSMIIEDRDGWLPKN